MSPPLDLDRLGRALQAMVERDGRPLLLRDEASGRLHRLPADLAGAPNGVMPSILAAAESASRARASRRACPRVWRSRSPDRSGIEKHSAGETA